MSYRIRVQERDFSQFTTTDVSEVGAMVVHSPMGKNTPVLCQSQSDVLKFGIPSAKYWGLFEALQYVQVAPLYVKSVLGEGFAYAGVDIKNGDTSPFGKRTGRLPESMNYAAVDIDVEEVVSIADGLTATFAKTLNQSSINENTLILTVGSTVLDAVENGGIITGSDLSDGSLNGGSLSITFTGTPGKAAEYMSSIDLTGGIDLSGSKNKAVNIIIDGKLIEDVNLGNANTTDGVSLVTTLNNAINTVFGESLDLVTIDNTNGEFIKITGTIGDATIGKIRISKPTDMNTYDYAVPLVFDAAAGVNTILFETTSSESPSGSIPKANQTIKASYIYRTDVRQTVSHSFLTASPFNDSYKQYAVKVTNIEDSEGSPSRDYELTLYELIDGNYSTIQTYTYSLDQKKNNYNQSIYIFDVFDDDDYLIPFVNTDYMGPNLVPSDTIISLTGGNRGSDPQTGDYNTAWDDFKNANKYPVTTFMDIYGNASSSLETLVADYHTYSFAITTIPMGYDASGAVEYASTLPRRDKLAVYTNWGRIEDVYNNSSAWCSQIGKVGMKYALMSDVFNALAPSGVDEENHGGILYGYRVLEVENDYDDYDLQILNEANINPIIQDPVYGTIIEGDKTRNPVNSDTSFIGTRRLYNLIAQNIVNQVLRRQVFKLNNPVHRLMALIMTEEIIQPIAVKQIISDYAVVCDESNNTPEVMNRREFMLDLVIKITPTSEFVTLRITRLSQTQFVADFI